MKFEHLLSYVMGVDVKDVTETSQEVEHLWLGLTEVKSVLVTDEGSLVDNTVGVEPENCSEGQL